MNRKSLQQISRIRMQEARTLLDGGCYPGAYYLIGYAVECALKACIAKQVKRYDFPDKKLWDKAYTHDLEQLVQLTGFASEFENDRKARRTLGLNWAVAKDWSESTRYEIGITEAQARDLYSACTDRNGGVLPWIRKRW